MLPSQRSHFDIPREVAYLNAASYSPLPLATQEAARDAVGRKGQPWRIDDMNAFAAEQSVRCRQAAARLINAEPNDVALIPSVAYGVAAAGKVLAPARGSRVLVIADDHSSPVLEWISRAEAGGFAVETMQRPADFDWTAAILASIEKPGAAPLSLVSFSSVHWCDGVLIDVARVSTAARAKGAAVLIDSTQSTGVIALDVKTLDPDFVIFPTYKWLLGPYGRAFVYVAKRHQGGVPLEQTSAGRRGVKAEDDVYFSDLAYMPDARRFDMGERDFFIGLEMAAIGMEMIAGWGQGAIGERLAMLTARLAEGLQGLAEFPDARVRGPHILSLRVPGKLDDVVARLSAANVHVAQRLGRLRIAPHVYNDEADVDRFVDAFRRVVG